MGSQFWANLILGPRLLTSFSTPTGGGWRSCGGGFHITRLTLIWHFLFCIVYIQRNRAYNNNLKKWMVVFERELCTVDFSIFPTCLVCLVAFTDVNGMRGQIKANVHASGSNYISQNPIFPTYQQILCHNILPLLSGFVWCKMTTTMYSILEYLKHVWVYTQDIPKMTTMHKA